MISGLILLSFGMMLGWPSPMFPKLFEPSAPIPFVFATSPLLAGYLMIGHIFGSFTSIFHRFRYRIVQLISAACHVACWTVLLFAYNNDMLYASRFLCGYGTGFALEAVKAEYKKRYSAATALTCTRLLNFYTFMGILLVYCIGPNVTMDEFSMGGIGLGLALVLLVLLASCFKTGSGDFHDDPKSIDHNEALVPTRLVTAVEIDKKSKRFRLPSLAIILRSVVLVLLVFVQQFTGVPATLVYNEFIFKKFDVPLPIWFTIAYALLLIITNLVTNFYLTRFNKKFLMLISAVCTLAVLCAMSSAIYAQLPYWKPYLLAALLFLYIIVHTIGLGTIPFLVGPLLFPENYRAVVARVQAMFYCAFAIMITKLFQVVHDGVGLYGSFGLFAIIAFFGLFVVGLFVPNVDQLPKKDKVVTIVRTDKGERQVSPTPSVISRKTNTSC